MINLTNLYYVRKVINNELSNTMKTDQGTNEYSRLCQIRGELDVLIKIIEKKVLK